MPKETMTARERWLAVLNRQSPDRIPMEYQATAEATEKLKRHLACETVSELFERLHIDSRAGVRPLYTGPPLPKNADVFGCRTKKVSYGIGVYDECIYHPLADYNTVEEIERNYTWPSVDWYDYSVIPDQIKGKDESPILGGVSEPFWTYKNLRGQEQAYMDLILNPEMVHHCLDRLYDFCYEDARRIYEQIPRQSNNVLYFGGPGFPRGLNIFAGPNS